MFTVLDRPVRFRSLITIAFTVRLRAFFELYRQNVVVVLRRLSKLVVKLGAERSGFLSREYRAKKMRNLLITLTVVLACTASAEAGHRASGCKPASGNCCQTTRWYTAKDGTYREMVPYMTALSRAEDADDMEIKLKSTREELNSGRVAAESTKSEADAAKAAMEAQIAELQKQLDAEKQNVVSQTERADTAEAAHKLCIETVAQLRDEARQNEENLASAKGELKSATAERDSLKSANAELEKQVADLNAAKTVADEARKAAQEELARIKQDAAKSKKAEVQDEPAPKDGDKPKTDGDKPTTAAQNTEN